jgi:Flp pilus assembly pilin Flp
MDSSSVGASGAFGRKHRALFAPIQSRESTMNRSRWRSGLARFLQEETAPTMMEYGLLVILIAIVAIVGVTALGTAVGTMFQNSADQYP